MNALLRNSLVLAIALMIATTTFAGESVSIRLNDGSRFRGELNDRVHLKLTERRLQVDFEGELIKVDQLYVVVRGDVAGVVREKVIMIADILEMEAVGSSSTGPEATVGATPGGTSGTTSAAAPTGNDAYDDKTPGVFVLPLQNTVGIYMRHEEMEAIAKEADKYGPGQIIVFIIDSPGGLVTEMETIHTTLMEIKKRHRLVAWIKEAISAACATSLHCDEIYFMTEGAAGAMTAFGGGVAWSGAQLDRWLQTAGEWAEAGGRSKYIAQAMIHKPLSVSYDIDPVTGDRTFYGDTSGEFVLSDPSKNLVLNARQAMHSGFADGIADTEEELAKLLHLPRWHEKSDAGRKMAAEWIKTVDDANKAIPKLAARLGYENASVTDPRVRIATRIKILKEALMWHRRCPNVAVMQLPPAETIEREIEELEKQLRDLRRAGN
jgi:hypothetical protein